MASEFRRDRKFEVVQAALLHHRPDARGTREIVDRLVPAPIESDAELLVEAVVHAGATARRVRTTTAAGAMVTVSALVLRNILRGR